MKLSPSLNVFLRIARELGPNIIRDQHELAHLQSSVKDPAGFVQRTLERTHRTFAVQMARLKPDMPLVYLHAEQPIIPAGVNEVVIVKLLDGIHNLAHNLPFIANYFGYFKATSEGWIEQSALIDNPLLKESYYADASGIAHLEEYSLDRASTRKLSVSQRQHPDSLLLHSANPLAQIYVGAKQINMGSDLLATAMMAAGRFDAASVAMFNNIPLGGVLVNQAGGRLSSKSGAMIACTPEIAKAA